jgi:uncharacterized membrane protein YfcA
MSDWDDDVTPLTRPVDLADLHERDEPRDAVEAVLPPRGILAVAAACVVVSAGLLLVHTQPARLLGYLVGTLGTISAVALFRSRDQRRRMDPLYSPRAGLLWVGVALTVVGVLVGCLHLWHFATEAAQ